LQVRVLRGSPSLQKTYLFFAVPLFPATWWKSWGLWALFILAGIALAYLFFGIWRVIHSEEFRRDLERLRAHRRGKPWWRL
jgi:hypothetical protein